jgi:hypothetical protein
MLKNAKLGIKDWKAASKLNPSMSKGVAWNIFAAHFDVNKVCKELILQKILVEFGDFLDIKPYMEPYIKKRKPKLNVEIYHEEPDFSNFND